jgi:hypothetical protein
MLRRSKKMYKDALSRKLKTMPGFRAEEDDEE